VGGDPHALKSVGRSDVDSTNALLRLGLVALEPSASLLHYGRGPNIGISGNPVSIVTSFLGFFPLICYDEVSGIWLDEDLNHPLTIHDPKPAAASPIHDPGLPPATASSMEEASGSTMIFGDHDPTAGPLLLPGTDDGPG